jgi:hypothetical protein
MGSDPLASISRPDRVSAPTARTGNLIRRISSWPVPAHTRYGLRHRMRYIATGCATGCATGLRRKNSLHGPMHLWCGPPAERARAAAGGEPRTREERLGPLELNTLKMGFRKAVGRLPGYRRTPPPNEKRPSLALSTTSPHRLCCSASAEAAHFFEAPRSFEFLFAPLALTLGSRPRQSRLGQTGGQSSATTPRVYNQTRTTTS